MDQTTITLDYRKETRPEFVRLLELVYRGALKAYRPGFFGDIDIHAPVHDGHGGKNRIEVTEREFDDLTTLWKSTQKTA